MTAVASPPTPHEPTEGGEGASGPALQKGRGAPLWLRELGPRLLDAYAANEPAFLRAVTTEPTLTGSQNLEARIGIPFTTMVPQFHYALHYDDVPGITPTAPWQHFPSWNIRNIYAGLNTDFSTIFLADFLRDYPVGFGAFTVNVGALRGGSATHLEISGAQAAKQLVALTAQNGGAPDPLLRMTVFRIQ